MKNLKLYLYLLTFILMMSCINKEAALEERNNPNLFLTIKEKVHGKLVPNIEGDILNHSKFTNYGNIILLVTYYSSWGKKLGTERFTYYPDIEPGERGHYSFNIHIPPPPQIDTEEITVSIVNATPVDR
jgi:hypothetical protein